MGLCPFFAHTLLVQHIYIPIHAKTLVEWSNNCRRLHTGSKYHNNKIVCVVLQEMLCSYKNITISNVNEMGPSSGDVRLEEIIDIAKHCY